MTSTLLRYGALAAIAAAATLIGSGPAGASDPVEHARFEVLDQTLQADVQPFTATVESFGNGHRLGGAAFEPVILRHKIYATQDAQNRVWADPHALSFWDTLRAGAWDGAQVEVLRVVNGAMRRVRIGRVPPNGHKAGSWAKLTPDRQLIAADAPRFDYAVAPWTQPGSRHFFTVRAVGANGRLSPPAPAVEILGPMKPEPAEVRNNFIEGALHEQRSADRRIGAPTGLTAARREDGVITLSWRRGGRGVKGYVVYRTGTPPDQHQGHFLDLADEGPAIRAGDMVLLRKKIYDGSRLRYTSSRVWNAHPSQLSKSSDMINGFSDEAAGGLWRLLPHDPDTPVENPGETYLNLRFTAGDGAGLSKYNHSHIRQSWYPVLDPSKTYRIEVWLRGRAPGEATLSFEGDYGQSPNKIGPFRMRYDTRWRKHVAEFKPPRLFDSEGTGRIWLSFKGSGEVDIDNFAFYRADAERLQLPPEIETKLKDAKMAAIRTHAFIKTGIRSYDLTQLTNESGALSGGARFNSLPQTLKIMQAVGADPWLQLEMHLTTAEWLGLAEYLAAPYDPAVDSQATKPWAHKRHLQGRTAPWLDAFDTLYFEIGNETWNGLFAPWVFRGMPDGASSREYTAGQVYGLYHHYVREILKQSPYWPQLEAKLIEVIGGWQISSYGQEAASFAPSADYVTMAAYNGGWDEGAGPISRSPQSYFSLLNNTLQVAAPAADRQNAMTATLNRDFPTNIRVGTYEAGPGYAMNGLNGAQVTPEQVAEQEHVMKGLAAGTATLDAFLLRAARGFNLQNYFTFGAGEYWKSHAHWYQGGQNYPSWDLLALFNRVGTGDMLTVKTLATPVVDIPKYEWREAVPDAPQIAVYATRKDDRLTLFVISRRVPNYPTAGDDGRSSVEIALPISSAKALTRYNLSGGYDASNATMRQVSLVERRIPLDQFSNGAFQIPVIYPGETLVFRFDGVQ